MNITTLCYLETKDSYLMLHRIRKQKDVNAGKWVGVGGHFEPGESPEECVIRETKEETGLTLTRLRFRGFLSFFDDKHYSEYICLYTADRWTGTLTPCDEGVLQWIPKEGISSLPLWEGDRIFLRLLSLERPFFSLKLCYCKERLTEAVLDGQPMELFDIRDETGACTGLTRERGVAHEDGTLHGTAHVWILRPNGKTFDVLLQKRSQEKDAFPGCYDISSAGHLAAGQDFLPSALRELNEELGLAAAPEELTFLGFHDGFCEASFYGRPFRNHEYSAVYVYQKPVDETSLHLQESEVESVCWLPFPVLEQEVAAGNPAYCIFRDELAMLSCYWESTAGDRGGHPGSLPTA